MRGGAGSRGIAGLLCLCSAFVAHQGRLGVGLPFFALRARLPGNQT
ncbi:hypothetical protein EPIB1_935 [Tritonibacter mobilis]|nr:hypothetical protein EPIB1_935 [Tritonibacter mobilis]